MWSHTDLAESSRKTLDCVTPTSRIITATSFFSPEPYCPRAAKLIITASVQPTFLDRVKSYHRKSERCSERSIHRGTRLHSQLVQIPNLKSRFSENTWRQKSKTETPSSYLRTLRRASVFLQRPPGWCRLNDVIVTSEGSQRRNEICDLYLSEGFFFICFAFVLKSWWIINYL